MVFLWNCSFNFYRFSFWFLWSVSGISKGIRRDFYGDSVVFLWNFYGIHYRISMGFLCGIYDMSMGFLFKFYAVSIVQWEGMSMWIWCLFPWDCLYGMSRGLGNIYRISMGLLWEFEKEHQLNIYSFLLDITRQNYSKPGPWKLTSLKNIQLRHLFSYMCIKKHLATTITINFKWCNICKIWVPWFGGGKSGV